MVQRTRFAPLLREQRVCAASVGGVGGGGFCLNLFGSSVPPPLAPPHKGEGNATSLRLVSCICDSPADRDRTAPSTVRFGKTKRTQPGTEKTKRAKATR